MEVLVADYGRTQAEQAAALNHLSEQAKNHTGAASNNMLVDVPVDTARYPSQSAYYLGNNKPTRDPDMLELIARSVRPGFSELQEAFDVWDEKTGIMRNEAENLKKGMNLLVGTNHSTLSDTGFVAAELAIKFGRLNDRELQGKLKTMIFMSKIVTFMGLNVAATGEAAAQDGSEKDYEYTLPETLSNLLCDHILLSVPQTESVKESARKSTLKHFFNIFKSFTDIHNSAVVSKQKELFAAGSIVSAMALGGTRDKTLAELRRSQSKVGGAPVLLDGGSGKTESKVVRLAPVTKGTAKIMMHERTKVLPVAVLMDRENSLLEVCDIPRAVNSQEDADEIMRMICAKLNVMDPTRAFEYYSYAELVKGGEISREQSRRSANL